MGKKFWCRHLWSRGYCVSTVGLDENKIRKYVRSYYLPNTVPENLYVPDYLYALIIALGFVISILAFMPPNPELQDNMDG
ncbi:MAG: transposase [Deltaproteobacteria bacterium]|nr:transposase [Deltaproteobacteria bacterium]MDL1961319.1 transposase [Deltaproteobacteria bacterium]